MLALTVTTTVNGTSTSGLIYIDPTSGAALGTGTATTDTVITYDPVDYESKIYAAVTNIGQVATVTVKVRESGKAITDAFQQIGGGTALDMDYTYTVERKPNETVVVPAGSYASCKLQINVTIANLSLEGGDPSNPFYSLFFSTLASTFSQPFSTTTWLTNQLPNVPKVSVGVTLPAPTGLVTTTQSLSAITLAPR